jgi:hypothetical protein
MFLEFPFLNCEIDSIRFDSIRFDRRRRRRRRRYRLETINENFCFRQLKGNDIFVSDVK